MRGSHKAGRVDHLRGGSSDSQPSQEQIVANPERVEQLRHCFDHVYFEADPGDAIFFHCNVLHHSEANHSDYRRAAYLVAYNRRDNNPCFPHQFPQYTPLDKVTYRNYYIYVHLESIFLLDIIGSNV